MSRLGALGGARAGLGLLLGTAAGLGFLCLLYSQRWKRTQRHGRSQSLPNSLDYTQTSDPGRHVMLLRAVPGGAGDASVLPSLPREGQEKVLDRLDFVLTSLVALRREVEELRSSLRGLAGEIVGEVRPLMRSSSKRHPMVSRKTSWMGPNGTLRDGACFPDATWKRTREWLGGEGFRLSGRGVTPLAPALSTSRPPREPRSQMLRVKGGKEEAEAALEKGDESADCHLWYAVLCGQLAEHESIQRRIQSGF
ncbi:regulator of microtubule dynamics 3, partial [Homo sapiens]